MLSKPGFKIAFNVNLDNDAMIKMLVGHDLLRKSAGLKKRNGKLLCNFKTG